MQNFWLWLALGGVVIVWSGTFFQGSQGRCQPARIGYSMVVGCR